MKSRLNIKLLKAGGVYDYRGKKFNVFNFYCVRKSVQRVMRFNNETNKAYRKHSENEM